MRASLVVAVLAAAALLARADTRATGSAAQGRETFAKLRCNSCHSVYREQTATKAPYPLRDFTRETPETVANLIVERTQYAPENLFDEQAMSACASQMTVQDLRDLVAYLRVKR